MSLSNKPATKVFHRVFCGSRMLNLFLCAIGPDIRATGMCIEETQAQVHQGGSLACTNMLNQAIGSFIGGDGIGTVNLFSIDAASLCPCDERTAPLDGRSG